MIQLVDLQRDQATKDYCKCRPICIKSKGKSKCQQIQDKSAKLLLEKKPNPENFIRWPEKFPKSPCPLISRNRLVSDNNYKRVHTPHDAVDTPCLRYADIAKDLGAWNAVRARCAFCSCGGCCPCGVRDYILQDAECSLRRRRVMRDFDARVKTDYMLWRNMYDKY